MSENENKVIELGDWKIELMNKGSVYMLGQVYHNGKEVLCKNIRIYMRYRSAVSMEVDGVLIQP